MISKNKLRRKLEDRCGCTIQHDGWPCGSCFNTMHALEEKLKEDLGCYWQAILDYRGDYDDYNWPIETDTSQFPELIEELYNQL